MDNGCRERNDAASAPTIATVGSANRIDAAEKTLSYLAIALYLERINEPATTGSITLKSSDSNINIYSRLTHLPANNSTMTSDTNGLAMVESMSVAMPSAVLPPVSLIHTGVVCSLGMAPWSTCPSARLGRSDMTLKKINASIKPTDVERMNYDASIMDILDTFIPDRKRSLIVIINPAGPHHACKEYRNEG